MAAWLNIAEATRLANVQPPAQPHQSDLLFAFKALSFCNTLFCAPPPSSPSTTTQMRLLNTKTLHLEEFFGSDIPEYAILSHTWGKEEVSFQEIGSLWAKTKGKRKDGFAKIKNCCAKAAQDGYKYCWIDTCCIDKTSSSELSEAINSMYQWYENAGVCYALLRDVPDRESAWEKTSALWAVWGIENFDPHGFIFYSKWFSRGWTLQELLAPAVVEFYAADWSEIGTKTSLCGSISSFTRINKQALRGYDPHKYTVAERMSWAADRMTTRREDLAYCLLGIFGVHMPLLYGEGDHAFIRLQEEIMKTSEDYTLFAWPASHRAGPWYDKVMWPDRPVGLLATSVDRFQALRSSEENRDLMQMSELRPHAVLKEVPDIPEDSATLSEPPMLSGRGLRISLPISERSKHGTYKVYLLCGLVSWSQKQLGAGFVCITLREVPGPIGVFERVSSERYPLDLVSLDEVRTFRKKMIYVSQPMPQLSKEKIHRDLARSGKSARGQTFDLRLQHGSRKLAVIQTMPPQTHVLHNGLLFPNRDFFSTSKILFLTVDMASFLVEWGEDDKFIVHFGVRGSPARAWCTINECSTMSLGLQGMKHCPSSAWIEEYSADRASHRLLTAGLGFIQVAIRPARLVPSSHNAFYVASSFVVDISVSEETDKVALSKLYADIETLRLRQNEGEERSGEE